MRWSSLAVVLLLIPSAFAFGKHTVNQQKARPLTDTVLFSLVVGKALPENIVHELQVRGLAFAPSESYRSALAEAGADSKILEALQNANLPSKETTSPSSPELIKRLGAASALLRTGKYDEASRELSLAADYGDGTEAAFVMGAVLREQNKWAEAGAVYEEILQRKPNFPQVHTKLSYILGQLGETDGALLEARTALEWFPDDAEAHKNMGVAFVISKKFDAAMQQYDEALRIKPDYAVIRFNIGMLMDAKGDRKSAIRAYRAALATNPDERAAYGFDTFAHYFLAIDLDALGDFETALREAREAVRGSPDNYSMHIELARVLMDAKQIPDAIHEYRELVKMFPNDPTAHFELAVAERTTDAAETEAEYRKAIELDPAYLAPILNLAQLEDIHKHFDSATALYRRAEQLNDDVPQVHRGFAALLLHQKDYAGAISELKLAEDLAPGDWYTHDLYGQALQTTGQLKPAIDEFRQALTLNPQNYRERIELELASALEQSGDWVGAMDQYRKTSFGGWGFRGPGEVDPSREYKSAQGRFQKHLTELRATGHTAEATALEHAIATSTTNTTLSQQLDATLQSGFDAMRSGKSNDALQYYKQAVDLAEKIQPHDQRLPVALKTLGLLYRSQNRFDKAAAVYGREMTAIQEISGRQSVDLADPLQDLGMMALQQKKYQAAEDDFIRAKYFVEKTFGPDTAPVATSLRMMAQVYLVQQDDAHAIPLLEQAVKIHEKTDFSGNDATIALYHLCTLYDRTSKYEQGAACHAQLVGVLSRLYSPDNSVLADDLTAEAKDLRALGRNDEAANVEDRLKHLKPSTAEQAADHR
jgi:tetratricopeptide (TPR) repeat protein